MHLTWKPISVFFIVCIVIFVVVSRGSANSTILESVQNDARYSTFAEAVEIAGLQELLNSNGPYTVFVPTNAAFETLPVAERDALYANPTELRQTLLYLTIPGIHTDEALKKMSQKRTALGKDIWLKEVNGILRLNDTANVTDIDIPASNGILHVVDTLVLPPAGGPYLSTAPNSVAVAPTDLPVAVTPWATPTLAPNETPTLVPEVKSVSRGVVETYAEEIHLVFTLKHLLLADGRFTAFLSLLDRAQLNFLLEHHGPFTLLAPTNDAFARLDLERVHEINSDPTALRQLLLHHILVGEYNGEQLSQTGVMQTAFGASVTLMADADGMYVNNARVVSTDFQGSNGVIHVIDSVLAIEHNGEAPTTPQPLPSPLPEVPENVGEGASPSTGSPPSAEVVNRALHAPARIPTRPGSNPPPNHTPTPRPTVESVPVESVPVEVAPVVPGRVGVLPPAVSTRPFRFGLAGSLLFDQLKAVVPNADRQIAGYYWGQVPVMEGERVAPVQLINACHFKRTESGGTTIIQNPLTEQIRWCWDSETQEMVSYSGSLPLGEWMAQTAGARAAVWLVGNEPDNAGQPDGQTKDPNGRRMHATPEMYALFFGGVAAEMMDGLGTQAGQPSTYPKLGFCQATYAGIRYADYQTRTQPIQDSGLMYCKNAYDALKNIIATRPAAVPWIDKWPVGVSASDVIAAVSTHEYVWTLKTCRNWSAVEGEVCYGQTLHENAPGFPAPDANTLDNFMNNWEHSLNEFAEWTNSEPGLRDKPLWLTEYGALWAYCGSATGGMRPGIDRVGGIPCERRANRVIDNDTVSEGIPEDDPVFYGRNEFEGLWGVHYRTTEYFLNPHNDPNKNQGDWQAAWYYKNDMSVSKFASSGHKGECGHTGWLFGHNEVCDTRRRFLSRAGETFRDTIACFTEGHSCPVSYGG